MKKNTRDYGKFHPRFQKGGPVQDDESFNLRNDNFRDGSDTGGYWRSPAEATWGLRQHLSTVDGGEPRFDRMPKSSPLEREIVERNVKRISKQQGWKTEDDPDYAGFQRGGPVKKKKR